MLVATWRKQWIPFLAIDLKPHRLNLFRSGRCAASVLYLGAHTLDWTVTMLTALVPCGR
jgi:hypothetical protein